MSNNLVEISFYKLTTLPLLKAAPKLIEKIYHAGQRLIVVGESEAIVKSLDDGLWVYSSKNFIPHGTYLDGSPEDQPVYLTPAIASVPNNAHIVMALGRVDLDDIKIGRYIYMFDGNNQEHLEFARIKWKSYQEKKQATLHYWQQKIDGTWEQK